MKNKWKCAATGLIGLLLALVVLDVFCYWYYNPAEYDWDDARATDNIREPGAFTSRAKEGFAWATMDENGYNNPQVPGEDGVFVLMMGSSHTEGLNVMQDETVPSLLEDMLAECGIEGCVYNIGISAHILPRNAANFARALEHFRPTGYVVLETQHVKFSKRDIEAAMNDSFERLPWTKPVLSEWISDRPLLRTLYRQWENFRTGAASGEDDVAAPAAEITQEQLEQYQAALTELFGEMRRTAEEYGVTPIIYYHPHLLLRADGTVCSDADEGCLRAFTAACETAGICFMDMTEVFMQAYDRQGVLPHGFSNTAPGVGHLNPKGNALIASALAARIAEMEAE